MELEKLKDFAITTMQLLVNATGCEIEDEKAFVNILTDAFITVQKEKGG